MGEREDAKRTEETARTIAAVWSATGTGFDVLAKNIASALAAERQKVAEEAAQLVLDMIEHYDGPDPTDEWSIGFREGSDCACADGASAIRARFMTPNPNSPREG